MNYIERAIEGLRRDVVLVDAAESRREIYDCTWRLMRVLGSPAVVLPTRWDNYFVPFDARQDRPSRGLRISCARCVPHHRQRA